MFLKYCSANWTPSHSLADEMLKHRDKEVVVDCLNRMGWDGVRWHGIYDDVSDCEILLIPTYLPTYLYLLKVKADT